MMENSFNPRDGYVSLKSESLKRKLKERVVSDDDFHGYLSAEDAASLAAQEGMTIVELAYSLLDAAKAYAVVPISGFQVGAVAVGNSGALYYGANMEFTGEALSFSVHGEQAATNNAWLNGETGIANLAINAAPCGYCRQFLYELNTASALNIEITDTTELLTWFLPDAFGPQDLGITGGLLDAQDHGLSISGDDEVVFAALAAANASYAPYTKTYSGIALVRDDGVFTGRVAENAAYNPSLSPLESALSFMTLYSGKSPYDYPPTRCVLVQAEGQADQTGVTGDVLSTVAPDVTLEVYTAT